MRNQVFALAALLLGMFASNSAGAFERYAHDGWGQERVVYHYGYYPRYRNVYRVHGTTDPYAYRYQPRGYYPYYNSRYWAPTAQLRQRRARYPVMLTYPPYYAAWGAPVRGYHHRAWHREHYGRGVRHW